MKQTNLAAYDGDGVSAVTDGGTEVETDEQSCPGPHHHEDDMCRACRAESTVEFNDGAVNHGVEAHDCPSETNNFVESSNPHTYHDPKPPSEQESSVDQL